MSRIQISGPSETVGVSGTLSLVTLAETLAYLELTADSGTQDALLQTLIDSACWGAFGLMGGRFLKRPATAFNFAITPDEEGVIYLLQYPGRHHLGARDGLLLGCHDVDGDNHVDHVRLLLRSPRRARVEFVPRAEPFGAGRPRDPHILRWDKVITFYYQRVKKKVPVMGEDGKPTTEIAGIAYITGRNTVELDGKAYSHADAGRCIEAGPPAVSDEAPRQQRAKAASSAPCIPR